ncbi:hypothetical protein RhiirA4_467734 [Rhizophagus irregularis]|uniref:Uncharacterized protein n=1 Tax=Rhizophagus irregularis TaxID=588596 RepID=A0A2I1GWP4_9GLOM|nr:hypothetical protein RhiirA4_467734 [Rhizophagus irregularis]
MFKKNINTFFKATRLVIQRSEGMISDILKARDRWLAIDVNSYQATVSASWILDGRIGIVFGLGRLLGLSAGSPWFMGVSASWISLGLWWISNETFVVFLLKY